MKRTGTGRTLLRLLDPRALALVALTLGATLGPAAASSPAESAARADLQAARDALARSRSGLAGEVTVRPRLDLLARDDPPRPLEADLGVRVGAAMTWSPLRSEILLNEARVLEAEVRLADARRDDVVARLRDRVERARADAAAGAAEDGWRAAVGEVESARADLERARGRTDEDASAAADEVASASRSLARAELDLEDARLDLREARHGRRALGDATSSDGGRERPDLRLPAATDVRELAAYRARALRLAADVAREERRRVDAFMPDLSLDAGYAGSDATLSGALALDGGRPRGRLEASWTGTTQERAWARLSATMRFGSDASAAAASPEGAAADARARLRELARALESDVDDALVEARARRARWRLAEAHLALEREEGDAVREARALDAARRDWLRFLRAAAAAAELLEVPLTIR